MDSIPDWFTGIRMNYSEGVSIALMMQNGKVLIVLRGRFSTI